jgi:hypothetical protein
MQEFLALRGRSFIDLVIDSMGEGKAEKQETNKKQKNKN